MNHSANIAIKCPVCARMKKIPAATSFLLIRCSQCFNQFHYPRGSADAYYILGLAYTTRRKDIKAIEEFTKAIKHSKGFSMAYYNRGIAYCQAGEYDRAIADYNEAIELDPDFAPAYYRRGISYKKKEDRDRAGFANAKRLKNLK